MIKKKIGGKVKMAEQHPYLKTYVHVINCYWDYSFLYLKKKTIAISFIKYLGIIIIQVYMENNNVLLECMNEVEIHFLPLPWNIRKKQIACHQPLVLLE